MATYNFGDWSSKYMRSGSFNGGIRIETGVMDVSGSKTANAVETRLSVLFGGFAVSDESDTIAGCAVSICSAGGGNWIDWSFFDTTGLATGTGRARFLAFGY